MSVFGISTQERDLSKFALAIQQLASGRSNATGSVTLTPNANTTTVINANCAAGSAVFLQPASASAAASLATTFVSAVTNRVFTLTHAPTAQTDRTFFYEIRG